jgi:hypothetical protein
MKMFLSATIFKIPASGSGALGQLLLCDEQVRSTDSEKFSELLQIPEFSIASNYRFVFVNSLYLFLFSRHH